MSLTVRITVDEASPYLEKMTRQLAPSAALHQRMAEHALVVFKRHFVKLVGSNRNKKGWKSSGFWQQMSASLNVSADDSAGYVAMWSAIALRYFGGTVRPVASKALAIAATEETYGTSPRQRDDLTVVWPKGSTFGWLAQRAFSTVRVTADKRKGREGQTRFKKGKDVAGGAVMFWLQAKATIKEDKNVMPDDDALGAAIARAAKAHLDDSETGGAN